MERPEENTRGKKKKDPRGTCQIVQSMEESRNKKRRTQASSLRGGRGWGRGAVVLRGGETRRIGSQSAADKFGEHFSCSGVIPGGLETQGLGKGPPGVLAGGAAEKSVLGCLDFLLTPWAKPQARAHKRTTTSRRGSQRRAAPAVQNNNDEVRRRTDGQAMKR